MTNKTGSFECNKIMVMAIVLIVVGFFSLGVGSYDIAPDMVLAILLGKVMHLNQMLPMDVEMVVMKVRLPRIIAAVLVGAALAASGAAYQGLFRNPMVSPGLLGVSAGASFGAALGILLSFSNLGIQVAAFVFGLLAVTITYLISTWLAKQNDTLLVMILTGIIISTLFSSFVSLVKYVADPFSKLPAIAYWLMGSLASIRLGDVYAVFFPIAAGLIVLTLIRWQLNVMSFGEEEAKALGIHTGRLRILVILCATLITSAAVSISGVITLVGLVVPHFARLLMGANYSTLMPASILMGGIYLLLVDDLARTLFAMEIPLGIITAIIGAPFFLYLLVNGRRGWV